MENVVSYSFAVPALVLMVGLFIIWIQHKAVQKRPGQGDMRGPIEGVTLEPTIAGGLSGKKIVVDPGHGGHDSGSTNGRAVEKDINLSVSLKLTDLLRARGATVVLTRDRDTFITLDERAAISNRQKCDIFVSVHTNSNEKPSVHGIETYYYSDKSESLSQILFDALVGGLNEKPNYIRQRNLRVLTQNERVACLTEHGYLSNVRTRDLLIRDEYQQLIADSICAGIEEYFRQNTAPAE